MRADGPHAADKIAERNRMAGLQEGSAEMDSFLQSFLQLLQSFLPTFSATDSKASASSASRRPEDWRGAACR